MAEPTPFAFTKRLSTTTPMTPLIETTDSQDWNVEFEPIEIKARITKGTTHLSRAMITAILWKQCPTIL
jgi:hypothetical protein